MRALDAPTVRSALRPALILSTLALLLGLVACDSDLPGAEGRAPINRATFIETYVELRLAAVSGETGRITEAERDRILSARGVTEDDLRAFIEVHGRDVPYMNELWIEVDRRIRAELEEDEEAQPPEPG